MRALTATLSLLLVLAHSGQALGQQVDSQQHQQQQLGRLVEQIKKLKTTISGTRNQRDKASRALRKIETEISNLARQQRDTRRRYRQQQQQLQELESRQQQLKQSQQQQKTLIAQQLRSAYITGNESQLKMLLNQQDPNSVSRMMGYYDYFNGARREQLQRYRHTLEEIQQLIPQIHHSTLELGKRQAELDVQGQQLDQQKQQRAAILANYNRELSQQQGKLSELDRQRQELEQVLEALEEEITSLAIPTSYQPFAKMKGKMPWPAAGRRLNNYGAPRKGSAVKWQGVQIAAAEGATVKAIHNGRVVYADWLRGHGLLLIIDHGGDYLSLYAHNQSLLRGEGEWVRAGEAIATAGNSGGRNQSGLYFEIRHRGKPSNPYRWCR